jgi:hypothetical protein
VGVGSFVVIDVQEGGADHYYGEGSHDDKVPADEEVDRFSTEPVAADFYEY